MMSDDPKPVSEQSAQPATRAGVVRDQQGPQPATRAAVVRDQSKRLAANRANAQKSTGPRTPEGKATSSRNSVKHGFRASSFAVVRLEDIYEIDKLKADAVACYKPVNAQELVAVERIALAQQLIFRGARLDAGMFSSAMNEVLDKWGDPRLPLHEGMIDDIEVTRAQNRHYLMAEGFRRIAKESNAISLMLRYRAQAERDYRRAIEDFDRLKALRNEMPNEPNVGVEPENIDDIATPHELNWSFPENPAPEPETAPTDEPNAATTERTQSTPAVPQSTLLPLPISSPQHPPAHPEKPAHIEKRDIAA